MPLSLSTTAPALPAPASIGDVNSVSPSPGQLHCRGKTYPIAPDTSALPIRLTPPLATPLPHKDAGGSERPDALAQGAVRYTVDYGKAGDQTLPPCNSTLQSRQQETREDRAARTIVKAFRQSVAHATDTYMIGRGSSWQDTPIENVQRHIKTLSATNMSDVMSYLGTLSVLEQAFFDTFMATPFIAVHCTDAVPETPQGALCLYSRKRLEERKITFNKFNSPSEDIALLGNDDLVFFSLEAGMTPQKPSSSLGRTMYHVDFEHPRLQQFGWLSLVDMRFPITPMLKNHVPSLTKADYGNLSERDLSPVTDTIFAGPQMKVGIALSLLAEVRALSESSREKLLDSPDTARINALMNGVFRPEVKVPRYFVAQTFQKSQTVMKSLFACPSPEATTTSDEED